MTESNWFSMDEPVKMLDYLRATATDRKLRLYLVACCRRYWNCMTDNRLRDIVAIAEQVADGLVSMRVRDNARRTAKKIWHETLQSNMQTSGIAALVWDANREKAFVAAIDATVGHALAANAPIATFDESGFGDINW